MNGDYEPEDIINDDRKFRSYVITKLMKLETEFEGHRDLHKQMNWVIGIAVTFILGLLAVAEPLI